MSAVLIDATKFQFHKGSIKTQETHPTAEPRHLVSIP